MLTGSSGYDIPTQEVFEALPGMVNNTNFVSLCRVGLWFPGTQSPFLSLWPTSWREVKSDYKSLNRGDRCVSEHTWFSPDPFHRLSKFTFSTWMRHRPREEVDKHRKEHVLCQADDHSEYFPQVQKVQFNFNSRVLIELKAQVHCSLLQKTKLGFSTCHWTSLNWVQSQFKKSPWRRVDCQILKGKKPQNFV